ncbi:hypothetical protein HYN59_10330 [Flavobacterium album]|uniref:TonB-dependent receptor n=2 Tax=Flavobacterium album TaxID=2175091 RepID=A0A2S1R2W1_9FLAO|nr:hypothetical protein HYN59_10330 [Flavobacterium album]
MAASAVAITLLTVGVNEVSAQTPIKTEQHETKTGDIDTNVLPEGVKIITGTVFDQQGLPLPGANIKVKGSIAPGVQTDFDGNFVIQASPREKLEVTFVGMKTQVVTVGFSATVPDVIMYDDPYIFMGEIIVEYKKLRISVASQYMFDY